MSASVITTAAAVTTAATAIVLAGMIAPDITPIGLMLCLLARAFIAMAVMRAGFAARVVMPAMMLARRGYRHVLVASTGAALGSQARCREGKLPLQKSEHQHGAGKHG
ncbi:MAG TPA: hypothetical protein VFL97_03365 [Nitrococcus sp.]|nr:hypothetical protein [Nitrococcus sp.]